MTVTAPVPGLLPALRRSAPVQAFASWKGGVAGTFLILVVLGALFAPWLTPYGFDVQNLPGAFQAPNLSHPMGTDEFGRDVLTRILYGARTSLSVSAVAIAISLFCGMVLGASAGYFGGRFDRAVMVVVDLTWAFPEILVALMLVAIIGPGTTGTLVAICVAYLAQFTRLTRAQVMALKSETFVEAARGMGASNAAILFHHLLPNCLGPVLVAGMLATGDAIILEATLGFFGLGAQPPTPSWGGMMSSGSGLLFKGPWIIMFPGLCIALTVVAINMFGDALLHKLDVRERVRTA
ncbi:dipeptide ABC transporter permease DppC [Gemmobacter nanjingensis]|uniref:Dipeptide ABC transporter permease DppC n=1 Tax=Gemmobacter nanjingensis TaxID=488454 RepID=A0ABQ3FN83_9RHOB|nr:ABC transporter permease [Gemmobacter nanjingensis]GHC31199.1 dipeptide ABC transporter permease DppC [Gemmobacter nanjingensis]